MPRHVLSLTLSAREHAALVKRAAGRSLATVARGILATALRTRSDAVRGRPPKMARADYTDALAHYGGDIEAAARALEVHPVTLRRACAKHGIALPWNE